MMGKAFLLGKTSRVAEPRGRASSRRNVSIVLLIYMTIMLIVIAYLDMADKFNVKRGLTSD
jgi:hypothetical protein